MNNKLMIILIITILLSATTIVYSQVKDKILYEVEASKNLIGTVIEAKVVTDDINAAKIALFNSFKEIERIDSLCSLQYPLSELNKININAGLKPVKINAELFNLIRHSIEYSKKYEGLFDITVGPLTELWGFSSDREIKVPFDSAIKSLLPLIDYKNVVLIEKHTSVFLPKKGMLLDLGGIAKGYAVDKAAQIMKEAGYRNFMLNAGGDIYCSGKNKDGKDWLIGIKHPRGLTMLLGKFTSSNIAVATSGDYERYIDLDGKRYHHILYPQSGMPGDKCQSVTVLYDNCEEANVLAKYIFLLGWERFKSLPLANQIKWVVVDADGAVNVSPLLENENGFVSQ